VRVAAAPHLARRSVLTAALGGVCCGAFVPARAGDTGDDDWISFRTRFVAGDGRIIDNGNGGVSHSEGQGWGLMFAVAFDDRASFNRIYQWTRRVLRRPDNALHAWRFVPANRPPVGDLNNATDGDIFIAAGLARAGRRWGQPDLLREAAAIARDIVALLVREAGPQLVMLPGLQGFESKTAFTVNPSYYALPMIAELARLAPSPKWDRVQTDGRALMERGRFGKWGLPPDWLHMNRAGGALAPASGWPPRFGFDAIRVPLWHTWQSDPVGDLLRAVERYWSDFPADAPPAWADLETNETAPYPVTPGMAAVMRLTQAGMGLRANPDLPPVASAGKYYDAALMLLSRLAWQERRPA